MTSSELSFNNSLFDRLQVVAEKKGLPVEELLESIVISFLSRNEDLDDSVEDRRCAPRVRAGTQAVVCVEEEAGGAVLYQSVVIEDISPDGFLLNCKKGKLVGCVSGEYTTGFLFDVLVESEEGAVQFQCKATRIELINDVLYIGSLVTSQILENKKRYEKFYQELVGRM